jgi:hypothetical protein
MAQKKKKQSSDKNLELIDALLKKLKDSKLKDRPKKK